MFSGGLPANLLAVKFGDGTSGFLDPADGTYYDAQGNDVTGYVQNFGGTSVIGPASQASIDAANGVEPTGPTHGGVPQGLPPGPSPRVQNPGSYPKPTYQQIFQSQTAGIPNVVIAGFAVLAIIVATSGGGRR